MRMTMNVSLPGDMKKWVDEQVKAGGYGTASEFMRDLLRRTQERQARRQIDAKLIDAVEDGATVTMDDADWAEIRRTARTNAKKNRKRSK